MYWLHSIKCFTVCGVVNRFAVVLTEGGVVLGRREKIALLQDVRLETVGKRTMIAGGSILD